MKLYNYNTLPTSRVSDEVCACHAVLRRRAHRCMRDRLELKYGNPIDLVGLQTLVANGISFPATPPTDQMAEGGMMQTAMACSVSSQMLPSSCLVHQLVAPCSTLDEVCKRVSAK
eukprot:1130937-Pleurochrysis_carterae.AAC.2